MQQHRVLYNNTEVWHKNVVRFFIFAFTSSTPLRKDTGVFGSFGRFIIFLLD